MAAQTMEQYDTDRNGYIEGSELLNLPEIGWDFIKKTDVLNMTADIDRLGKKVQTEALGMKVFDLNADGKIELSELQKAYEGMIQTTQDLCQHQH